MKKLFLKNQLASYFVIFVTLNILLYIFIFCFHNLVTFQKESYFLNYHHFLHDPRAFDGEFDFLTAFASSDAQWYLKIAQLGYSNNPNLISMVDKTTMEGLTYAFFPLYPLSIKIFSLVFKDIHLSAFILSNTLLIANFFSLYFVIKNLFSKNLALKTIFLIFLFPFSIFFRSYFTESLQLLLLVWFSYFFIKKKFIASAVMLSFLNITKGNMLLLNLVFLVFVFRDYGFQKIKLKQVLTSLIILPLTFLLWMGFCFIKTGDPIFFYSLQKQWVIGLSLPVPIYNLVVILNFFDLPLHYFHLSKIDVLLFLTTALLLYRTRKLLKPELWWISSAFWLTLFLGKDLMSYSRYTILFFPLFLYLAQILKGKIYFAVISIFAVLLFLVSLFFVNWYWVG